MSRNHSDDIIFESHTFYSYIAYTVHLITQVCHSLHACIPYMLDQRPQIVASVNFDSSISARGSQQKLLLAASYMYVATSSSLLVLHKDFIMAEFKFMQLLMTN